MNQPLISQNNDTIHSTRLIPLARRLTKFIPTIPKLRYVFGRIIGYLKRIRFELRPAELTQTDLLLKQETGELLSRQIVGRVFNRMDIIVRYLAIEECFGLSDFGLALYQKMQEKRGHLPHSEDNFHALIKSITRKGFNPHSCILVDERQRLIDGSHRMACALYFGVKEVSIEMRPGCFDTQYGIDWFQRMGFSPEEVEIIQNKQQEIFKQWGLF